MKPLLPFAFVSAVSFAFMAGQLAPAPEALACGDYMSLMTELTQADVDLAVSLLEKQVPDRLTALGTAQPERKLFSRAAPRPVTASSVVVLSYQAPRVGDRAWAESKTVFGPLTVAANGTTRTSTRYRIDLATETVQLLKADKWVAAAEWTRTAQAKTEEAAAGR